MRMIVYDSFNSLLFLMHRFVIDVLNATHMSVRYWVVSIPFAASQICANVSLSNLSEFECGTPGKQRFFLF